MQNVRIKKSLAAPAARQSLESYGRKNASWLNVVRIKAIRHVKLASFMKPARFGGDGIIYQSRDSGKERMRKNERKKIIQKSRTLGKWLWVLFWLVIPMILASVMTNESIAAWFPFLNFPGKCLNITCSAAYGVILLILSSEERHYRISGICALVAAVVSLLLINVPIGVNEAITMGALVLTLPAAVVSLIGEYHEYMGHAEVAGDVDADLSEKWSTLWKWYMGMFAGLFGGLFVMLIIPILGLLVLLAAAIGFLVVSILKLVYLYRTANLFRRYAQTENDTVEKSF